MSRSRDYVNGVPCEVAERIMRKRKKPVKVFRRRDDDLKVIFQSNTRQTTLRKIAASTALEEKAILRKVGAKFDTEDKRKKLYAFRLQGLIANRILFSNLWQIPDLLKKLAKDLGYLGLTEDESVKYYLDKI